MRSVRHWVRVKDRRHGGHRGRAGHRVVATSPQAGPCQTDPSTTSTRWTVPAHDWVTVMLACS
ncbi:hypothetical protein ASG53_00620 [Sanguibacter sp. Leaf3]|nr:hypothetical protein ASG53_00620 [Sanguibacter sp. Leaf3]